VALPLLKARPVTPPVENARVGNVAA